MTKKNEEFHTSSKSAKEFVAMADCSIHDENEFMNYSMDVLDFNLPSSTQFVRDAMLIETTIKDVIKKVANLNDEDLCNTPQSVRDVLSSLMFEIGRARFINMLSLRNVADMLNEQIEEDRED